MTTPGGIREGTRSPGERRPFPQGIGQGPNGSRHTRVPWVNRSNAPAPIPPGLRASDMRPYAPALLFLALLGAPPAAAQESAPPPAEQGLLVFLDCNALNCDFDHFRRELQWVNWVRDREDADVHLLITAEETGGGGLQYALDYLGRRGFSGTRKRLTYVSDPNDTDPEVREGLTRTIALGLVQFVETTSVAPRLEVVYRAPDVPVLARDARDPWNLWVFEFGANGSLEGEAQQSEYDLEGSATASRVSEALKLIFDLDLEYRYEDFELDDTTTVTNSAEDYRADALAAWSLGKHWSVGGTASTSRSTFLNQDLAIAAGPALEYDLFPYSESTRRLLLVRYGLEAASFNYQDTTIEGKVSEVLPRHTLTISAAVQQPWGEIDGAVEAVQYLDDLSSHRVDTFLSVEYRLFRGFSLDLFAQFSRIKDQFYLPAGDLSEEEILLERRQRETDYRFDLGIGFSYRFGSKFANVVNPRFQGPDFH